MKPFPPQTLRQRSRFGLAMPLETIAAWTLGFLWLLPLVFAAWTAFHPPGYAARFSLFAPLTFDNFRTAWQAAPFARYFLNTTLLVTGILIAQFILCTLAAFAFARLPFRGRDTLFMLILVQLMVAPEILLVENYRTIKLFGLVDTLPGIALPYLASAFGIFLLRQTFKTIPRDLEDAARIEGCGLFGVILRVYVPLARPVYLAYGLVSVSWHWNNFLWPLIITNSVETRPLTVGLSVFATSDQGIDWSIINAATLMTSGPLLLAFLLFQRQFVQSFIRAGIR
jgi:sn-glycerol 3-phosphate transport system permease protein